MQDIRDEKMFGSEQIGYEQKDTSILLKKLNLSETFLSKDISNFHCFMEAFQTLVCGKPNFLESINLSKNEIRTLDVMQLDKQYYNLWD